MTHMINARAVELEDGMSAHFCGWVAIKRVVAGLSGVLALLAPSAAHAQNVVLNPGYISGTIQVDGETVSSAYLTANGTAPDGTSYQASTSVNSGSYTLTVNVPAGTTLSYTVSANVYLDGNQHYLQFPSQTIDVIELQTATADFLVAPGYVEATVTADSGSLSYGQFYAYSGGGNASGSANVSGLVASLTFPVIPDNTVSVTGYVFLNGGYIYLDYQSVAVATGDTVPVSWDVVAPQQGALGGTFQFNGAVADQHYINVSGASYGSQTLTGNGNYEFTSLGVGSYYLYGYSYFDNFSTYLQLPDSSFNPSRYADVAAGSTTNVDISTDAAFIQGKLTLTGTKSLAQASYASLDSSGASPGNSQGGYASTQPNLQTGAYRFIVTDGSWIVPYQLSLQFYDPDPSAYLNSSLYLYDYQSQNSPVSVTAGNTVTKNLTYGTGTVTVNYSVAGGGTLSSPYLTRYCTAYDQSNQLVSQYYVSAYGNQTNVTNASVTFVGMGATCRLDARATVGGSDTSFGIVDVEVVPGADQVVDIGGPALTISFPPAGYITSNGDISVTGSAIDDVAVDGVTVNGSSATLSPSAPASQVGFDSMVSLNLGPNQIVTVATDTSGQSATDTRTVYRDNGPPSLDWTPADGATSALSEMTASGAADDDAGIASITVNGMTVFQSANPGSGPTQQAFSTQVPLAVGDNFIEVVVTDISTQITAQTHKVTRILFVDSDADGVADNADNCPQAANASQADLDGDGIGDACDADLNDGPLADPDGDGLSNQFDSCDQAAEDADGIQDADGCPEADADGDGVPDGQDAFPLDATESVDTDGDGTGNNADADDDNDQDPDTTDCARLDPAIHHGATEIVGNGIDENCDGSDANSLLIVSGLLPPYEAPPDSFKIGRTLPIKWQFLDPQGQPVSSSAANPQVSMWGPVSCGATDGDVITINDSGASGYHYDAATFVWGFNLSTRGFRAGCYYLQITSPLSEASQLHPLRLK